VGMYDGEIWPERRTKTSQDRFRNKRFADGWCVYPNGGTMSLVPVGPRQPTVGCSTKSLNRSHELAGHHPSVEQFGSPFVRRVMGWYPVGHLSGS
jgi:hypothetical protein